MSDIVHPQIKNDVTRLQYLLLKMPQADIVTEHVFRPGVYERKITIPPWTVLTGAEHKTDYRVRIESGTIAVTTDDGVKILTGPIEFYASSGMQRAGRVFDCPVVWVDIYDNPENITDTNVLEAVLYVVPDCGLASSRTVEQRARVDYAAFLHQIGLSQPEMDAIVMIDDKTDRSEIDGVGLLESKIHGLGLFATKNFIAGDVVCPGRVDGHRTIAGRYINHSIDSNVKPVLVGDDIHAVATRNIAAGEELLVDYRASMRVNFGLHMEGELL